MQERSFRFEAGGGRFTLTVGNDSSTLLQRVRVRAHARVCIRRRLVAKGGPCARYRVELGARRQPSQVFFFPPRLSGAAVRSVTAN